MISPNCNATRASVGRWAGLVAALALVLGVVQTRTAAAEMSDYRVTDTTAIYHGNCRLFTKPCVVKADRVYRSIPEYKEILDKGLTDKDVRYHFLMKKASERFVEGVKRMARELNQDLVGELGAIKAAKTGVAEPLERTDDVISRLG
jgi:hypothetical protein